MTNCFSLARQSPVCHGILIIEVSRSHSDTPHSVGLLWTNDQPGEEISTRQHSFTTDINTPAKFEPGTPVTERPQTHALDRAAIGTVDDLV
jgi:hypothetical protein